MGGDAMDTGRGTFTSAHELLDILRRRQAEIGLSNEALEYLAGLTAGEVNKYLGPGREKFPGLFKLICMMDALGLSGSAHVDLKKVERMTPRWRLAGKRRMAAIRAENPRVSREMIRRAAPEVLRRRAQAGGIARRDRMTAVARIESAVFAARTRWGKRKRK